MPILQTRRRFLSTLSLAGAAGLLRPPAVFAAEGRLETTSVRLAKMPDMCMAPQLVGQELLRDEGFTDIQYVDTTNDQLGRALAANNVDLTLTYIQQALSEIDRGSAITMIGGVMVGCVEVFAQEGIRSIGELKGRKLGVRALGSGPHGLLSAMLAHVGLDPAKDVEWVADPLFVKMFADGKVDAIEIVPPASQELDRKSVV